MNKIEQIKLRNNEKNKGFEIITLENFFESANTTFIRKHLRTDFYNLIFVTKGTFIHEIDFKEYTIEAGELLIISNNRVHRYREFENVKGYLIMFTEGFLCEFLSNDTSKVKDLFKQSYINPQLNFVDLYISNITKLLEIINDMYTNANHFHNYEVIASTFMTLATLILQSNLKDNELKHKKNEIFIQFTELVEDHMDKEKTVEAYAHMMHVSKKTVNLMTRKAIDMSAKQYIIQQLILQIKLKLCLQQNSINEIANELGFTESSNLTKFFKKYTKMNPKEFRNMNMDNKDLIISESINLELIKESIEINVHHIHFGKTVHPNKHKGFDEIFYCIKGSGFGILEDTEIELNVGTLFFAPARKTHSLRSDGDLYVISVLIPVIDKKS